MTTDHSTLSTMGCNCWVATYVSVLSKGVRGTAGTACNRIARGRSKSKKQTVSKERKQKSKQDVVRRRIATYHKCQGLCQLCRQDCDGHHILFLICVVMVLHSNRLSGSFGCQDRCRSRLKLGKYSQTTMLASASSRRKGIRDIELCHTSVVWKQDGDVL